jgi:hypothetical protein
MFRGRGRPASGAFSSSSENRRQLIPAHANSADTGEYPGPILLPPAVTNGPGRAKYQVTPASGMAYIADVVANTFNFIGEA